MTETLPLPAGFRNALTIGVPLVLKIVRPSLAGDSDPSAAGAGVCKPRCAIGVPTAGSTMARPLSLVSTNRAMAGDCVSLFNISIGVPALTETVVLGFPLLSYTERPRRVPNWLIEAIG